MYEIASKIIKMSGKNVEFEKISGKNINLRKTTIFKFKKNFQNMLKEKAISYFVLVNFVILGSRM